MEKVKSKIISTNDLEIKLNGYIQKTIDELSSFQNYYLSKVRDKLKYAGLAPY